MADWQSLDPEAAREAEKYENPIPSRELILQHLGERGSPAAREELVEEFGLESDEDIEALRRRLRAMERDGQLIYTRRGTYAPVDKLDLVCGRVSGHRDGFGFLIPDDGSDDLFLSPAQMRLVFDGDRCLARVAGLDRRGRREGAIVEVISRAHESIVGRYHIESDVGFVIPDNPKIQQEVLVTPGRALDAKPGQFVEVKITHWPTQRFQPQGDIVEVIGNYMAPGMEIDVALRSFDIPHVWPEAVLKEAARLKPEVEEKDKHKRVDLRHLPFVTIDGEDARDFDDAVYCEKPGGWKLLTGGFRLYVAIADVSHYVKVDSALDKEAVVRGNSVYFPERVVPMLPEELSNGLCSLNPHVDRLAMVCEITLSKSGKMTDYQFYEAVMHSHARLTYNKVSTMLEQPKSAEGKRLSAEYAEVLPHLKQLYSLYKVLLKARHTRGAIDFETQETRIVFGADRKIAEIKPTERNDAHKLIEECMLCANVATATFLQKHEIPALYRVHDAPPLERQEKLRAFLGELGLSLHKGKEGPTPKDYQALLEKIQGRPDFHVIQTVMLRSLSQAVYSAENHGHFGLNYEAYAHFTSPIRRYPDLLVHRAIRSVIRSRRDTPHVRREGAPSMPKARIYPYDEAALEQLGEQCSMTERRADEATRDVVNWLKCEFMKDRVGETFPGVITAVTGFGLFVELTDIYVEGLVHVTAMPGDYYHFDPLHHRLSGERSGRSFRLGDSVEVRVMRVDLDERKIDFELTAGGTKAAGQRDGAERGREPGNADIRKSRELKKALIAEAKVGGRKGKSDKAGGSKSRSGTSKAKSAAKSTSKPSASSSGPRKRKAKS
ncbi:Ribonuclease R [Stutzerimonas frequens]|uniref:ribonuclease R n=1 Tax=Stutzerimonas frequens TaxID=2968969 RepID=UPI001269228B|nr:ribonuclease R [Stutzerimonas frequens]MBK3919602.1 ribonuclease R [Stutzerimonas frequens]MEC7472449.1 ribonuclease R [Pseudomonadota bacterium]NCT78054.1 ribonuclease R [Stutzerimonas stutzeri]QFU13943.1 Ribonuclease R [Stutzerimonas frequens]|tara:strand:+ start:438 stop:2939 length:2502 start_codon:yes stop_codon:yes gene_type:complete